jgi:hypothetical protein
MALWGVTSGSELRPKWIATDTIGLNHDYDRNKVYATQAGWVVTHKNGYDELLVAISGLSDSLGAADIVGLEWGEGSYFGAGTQTVVVVYNEAITVVGHPTLAIAKSTGGTITATHTSTDKNRLTFTFTIQDAAGTLSVATQDIGLNGGTLTDADGLDPKTSGVTISAAVAAAIYPAATQVVVVGTILSATWKSGTYTQGQTGNTLTVVYDRAVTVAGGTPTIATLWSGVAGPAGPVATYASGTGTETLVFNLAAIPSQVGTLSLGTQSIAGTGTLKDSNTTSVDKLISPAVASAAATKVVA